MTYIVENECKGHWLKSVSVETRREIDPLSGKMRNTRGKPTDMLYQYGPDPAEAMRFTSISDAKKIAEKRHGRVWSISYRKPGKQVWP